MKNIEDYEKELSKGNPAVGIIVAAVFVAIALVVQSGVSGLSVGIGKQLRLDSCLLTACWLLAQLRSIDFWHCPRYSGNFIWRSTFLINSPRRLMSLRRSKRETLLLHSKWPESLLLSR
jgi:hypothetical protein